MKKPACMLGLAIGDALGMPFEFCNADIIADADWEGDFQPGMEGERTLVAGQWTDDTKMAICLAQSLIECVDFELEDVATKYVKWFNSGDLRGIGIQTQWAMQNIVQGVPLDECGEILHKAKRSELARPSFRKKGRTTDVCGNGTAMRVAPLGVYFREDPVKLFKSAIADAILTHDHPSAKDASLAVAYMAGSLANNEDPVTTVEETIALLGNGLVKEKMIAAKKLAMTSKGMEDALTLGHQGTAHETVGSAVYCFLRFCGDGFKSVVINAVRMGGDTDTRAAIAGALAGTYVGIDALPEEYEGVENAEFLLALDQVLPLGPKELSQ